MIGRVLTRYQLLEEVGHGGMAVVYRGIDTALGREVAVKVLHPHLCDVAESRARLEREAQAVAKLRHENILEIYDFSDHNTPERFLVTEFIHGQTLTEFHKHHPIELPEVAEMIVSEVAAALEHAHSFGVIHRDVKPENVMIRNDGLIKLTDFGIAQIVDKERLTVTGQLLGSPAYMAPEHVEGGRIDFRTDVFATGTLLYQLATGSLPFTGKNPHEVLKRIAEGHFVPPEQVSPLVGTRLARIINRALARLPDHRYAGPSDMRRELLADLADAGIHDVRAELAAYFADPETAAAKLRGRIVTALGVSGRKYAEEGKTAAALALWSHALALSPNDRSVRRLLDGLTARRRRWRLTTATVATAVGCALVVALFRLLPERETRPDMGTIATHATVMPATPIEPVPSSAAARVEVAPPRPETRRYAGRPAPRLVSIHTIPKNVGIFVDGEFVGNYGGPPIPVSPGAHELRFTNPCCIDARVRLEADEVANRPVKLEWKSARIVVTTSPDGADVVYTTSQRSRGALARGGQEFRVPIPRESETGEVAVHLTVSAPGYRQQELDLTARAGQLTRRSIDLVPSP